MGCHFLLQALILLLLSCFSRVRLCATPQTAAHQAPPSLGFSRQEHWSGLPFPSPIHASERWKWSRSVMSDPQWPHGLQPMKFLPWDFPGKSTGVGCHCLVCAKHKFELWKLVLFCTKWTAIKISLYFIFLTNDKFSLRNNFFFEKQFLTKNSWNIFVTP